MASEKINRTEVLAKFFDEGAYTSLFAEGAVSAAFGSANGKPAYAVYQNGEAVSVKDLEKQKKVLELAAGTGNPVVTFYNSKGAKLEQGLEVLKATSALNAAIADVSGVVPQVAVVIGVCAASNALNAAAADLCIMSEGAELSFTAPFTSAAAGDKVEGAGSAAFAAKAGVAAVTVKSAAEAAELAAHVVGLLPSNNLAGPSVFEFEAPVKPFVAGKAEDAVSAIVDKDSAIELFSAFGKNVVTALATVNGNAVGVVAIQKALCHNCTAKASRFVRLCDAFSVPVITVVDAEGFVPSSSDDLAGGIREAARLAGTYADATTAKISVIAGAAYGPVYTAVANADVRIAVEGSHIAPLAPNTAVSVLYKAEIDASDNIEAATKKLAASYASEACSASAAIAAGVADLVCAAADVRGTVVAALDMMLTKRASRMPKKHGNMAL